jgi:trehalose 6-phosphate phosphatase
MTHWRDATETLLAPLLRTARLGIITDFDGTLSPIIDDPAASAIAPASKAALTAMQPKLALLAVVSGRGAADIHRMTGIEAAVYVGNHGMERWVGGAVVTPPEAAAYRPNLERVMAALEPRLVVGMVIEDKGATASVHYRRTADPAATAEQMRPVLEQITGEHDIELHTGKMIFELRPPIKQDKGTAFRALVDEFKLTGAVFLGDDVTDAAALRASGELRTAGTAYGVGVGVRHPDDTPQPVLDHSDVFADGVGDVSAFFGWLSNALSASST